MRPLGGGGGGIGWSVTVLIAILALYWVNSPSLCSQVCILAWLWLCIRRESLERSARTNMHQGMITLLDIGAKVCMYVKGPRSGPNLHFCDLLE